MDRNSKILSDLTVYSKYARFLEGENRRETFEEIVDRNKRFWLDKYPQLSEDIERAYALVLERKVLPSMRTLQFAGPALDKNLVRSYNCSFTSITDYRDFSEIMFLLLAGVGVGYSVQKHHIAQLPSLKLPSRSRKYIIADSIEGWADSVRHLMKAFMESRPLPRFDYSEIRPKGTKISSGGLAPGPEPLRRALSFVESLLREKIETEGEGCKLTPLEAHDVICVLANAVLAGGVRRSALLCMFSKDDYDMMSCKDWDKIQGNEHRYRSNNSVVLIRDETTEEEFRSIWNRIREGGSGEPGVLWTNDPEMGVNPCCEIHMRSKGFCNLTEVNVDNTETQEDFEERVWAATLLGTLQATLVDFHYLSNEWRKNCEEEALLGASMTGIASGKVLNLDIKKAAEYAVETNRKYAKIVGINPAARVTTVKPAGTTSIVVGSSSGAHPWHAPYYIRRVRLRIDEPLAVYLAANHPEIITTSVEKPDEELIVEIPIKAPEGSIFRNESSLESALPRVKRLYDDWIKTGHISGNNTHNVSYTLTVKNNEWDEVIDWLWNNKDSYCGITVFPEFNGFYAQAPFEDIDKEEYDRRSAMLTDFDITQVKELVDNTQLEETTACAAGACEVKFL